MLYSNGIMEPKHTILITGAAGYVGEMLCDLFSAREDVRMIIALDKEPQTTASKALPKVVHIQQNMADDGWQEEAAKYEPDVVIHTAWQIRALYGKQQEQWRWNIEGSKKVFDFAFDQPSVRKLIHFSTAASYSARASNTFEHFFTEAEPLRDDAYLYAQEKKESERILKDLYDQHLKEGKTVPQVFVVRPAAITGPRGRFLRIRFGLQSALQGTLKGGFVNTVVRTLTAFMPASKGWVRQFIHEDDVADIVALFAFRDLDASYEVCNITPPGDPVFAHDMGMAVGKRVLMLPPFLVRTAFFFFWHATRGKIPTASGSWRFYVYPLLMDGSYLTKRFGYTYAYSSRDAITYSDGRYESKVNEGARKSKPR